VDDLGWTWTYLAEDGSSIEAGAGSDQKWPTQADAESWLGEAWRDLLAAGVDAVMLAEGDRPVYGPMSLHPPGV
jgi:hypothetical protein